MDFDNTIAGYDKWRGPKVLGPPVPYALDAILELIEWGWQVVIFTTRGNKSAIEQWLRDNNFPELQVNSTSHNPADSSHKPIAEVYFDDRDAHCVGNTPYNWHSAMARVRRKYRPQVDCAVDDAAAWASLWRRYVVAPFVRYQFRDHLALQLDERSIMADDKLNQAQKDELLLQLWEADCRFRNDDR